ncbi:urease accessory protein UreF [Candidatus Falkowbacteria bacterium]|nr:urease accessory protein UreF [Candidatus Falkowbacteria bacterium]
MTAALMQLVQWLSPAFPVGGFAYSHGLEWAIAQGGLAGAEAIGDWISDVIGQGSGRVDACLLAASLRPGADHAALAGLARALAAARERAVETEDQGRAFTDLTNTLTGTAHPPAPLPVAVGRAVAALGLPAEQVVALYLQTFAGNLVQVAVRFAPLGQTEGQRMLAGLQPLILRVAAEAVADPDAIGSAAFGADMAAMAHEVMEVRIYKT